MGSVENNSQINNLDVMSLEDLQKECLSMRKILTKTNTELEAKTQEVYDYNRQLNRADVMEKEYTQEIETLQGECNRERERLKEKIQNTEIQIQNTKQLGAQQMECLEKEIVMKENNIKELCVHLKASHDEKVCKEYEITTEENAMLQLNLEELQSSIDELLAQCKELQQKKSKMLEYFTLLRNSKDSLLESLSLKANELAEAKDLILTLQDELLAMQCQVEVADGNCIEQNDKIDSLFAEVDDRRLQIQSDVRAVRNKLLEMKKLRDNYAKLTSSLKAENIKLRHYSDLELKEVERDDNNVFRTYSQRIETLEMLRKTYEDELSEIKDAAANEFEDSLAFLDKMMESKRVTMENLERQQSTLSLNKSILSHQLRSADTEKKKLVKKIGELNKEINELQKKVVLLGVPIHSVLNVEEETKLINQTMRGYSSEEDDVSETSDMKTLTEKMANNVGTNKPEMKSLKSIVASNKEDKENCIKNEDCDEFCSGSKKVTFSEDTKFCITNQRAKKGKLLQPKQRIYVPSSKK